MAEVLKWHREAGETIGKGWRMSKSPNLTEEATAVIAAADPSAELIAECLMALAKYGAHQNQCGLMRMVCPKKSDPTRECMCGLDAALARLADAGVRP